MGELIDFPSFGKGGHTISNKHMARHFDEGSECIRCVNYFAEVHGRIQ